MEIGAHVPNTDPIAEADERDADIVQIFLSSPQQWKAPAPRDDAQELKSSEVGLYVHAPYLINVVSPNNRIRIPSRRILADTCAAAEDVGARAVIVHGGHLTDTEEAVEVGFERWRKALEPLETSVPVLIENTAGGDGAMARNFDVVAELWEKIGDLGVGFCLDTCHSWAAGEAFEGLVDRVLAATGRIDLVHCNSSRDPFDSRRDRHANLGEGEIPTGEILALIRDAGAPLVVETPGGAGEQGADIAWVRSRL